MYSIASNTQSGWRKLSFSQPCLQFHLSLWHVCGTVKKKKKNEKQMTKYNKQRNCAWTSSGKGRNKKKWSQINQKGGARQSLRLLLYVDWPLLKSSSLCTFWWISAGVSAALHTASNGPQSSQDSVESVPEAVAVPNYENMTIGQRKKFSLQVAAVVVLFTVCGAAFRKLICISRSTSQMSKLEVMFLMTWQVTGEK